MKVILKKFVKGIGREGEVVEVSDGYARNALFPRKLAVPATKAALSAHETKKKSEEVKEKKEKEEMLMLLYELDGKTVEIKGKANEKRKLYTAIHMQDIKEAIEREFGKKINEQIFTSEAHIKELGEYEIPLEAFGEKGKIRIQVIAE